MTCKICNSDLIYIEDILTCPKCENVSLVPYEDSIKIADHYIKIFNDMFESEIRKYNKIHVISNAFWFREKQIRKFLEKFSTIDLAKLVSSSLLIRRIAQMNYFQNEKIMDDGKISSIIILYSEMIKFEEDKSKLLAETWNMVKLFPYDINHLEKMPLTGSIIVCPNEKYDRIMNNFEKHGLLNEKTAQEKMKEYSNQPIHSVYGSNKSHTSRETISRFYELISMFYVAFFRSKVYIEAFGLPNEKIGITPIELKQIITSFPIHNEGVSCVKVDEIRNVAKGVIGGRVEQLFKNFVLSPNNLSATPLLLQLDSEYVLLSQAFTELYSYPLHAIINKNEFDQETIKRSKIFESTIVKENFEKKGFNYKPNYVVKNKMEIDGIAISDSIVYVIEVKGWGSKKLIEETSSRGILEKEIKNAIDGIHIHVNTGKTKRGVSLPKKVSWVSNNKKRLKIKESAEVKGVLVINEPPPFTQYSGCDISFVDDFEYIKTGLRR